MSEQTTPKPWYKKWWAITLFIILALIVIGLLADNDNSTQQKNGASQQQNEVTSTVSPVVYEIVESEDQSHKALGNKSLSDYTTQEISNLPMDKKMLYRIVVSPEIKENEVRPTIQKIISDITQKDNDIDEITLFLYSDKELSSGSYDIGTATWAPKGKLGNVTPEIAQSNDRTSYETTIQIKENLEEYLQQRGKSEDKLGLTEQQRRQIFIELVAAGDRSTAEAEKKYPIDDSLSAELWLESFEKNDAYNTELMNKYKSQVRLKYGITEEQEKEISREGSVETWPME